jgi:integrase
MPKLLTKSFHYPGKRQRSVYQRKIPKDLVAVLNQTVWWERLPRDESQALQRVKHLSTLHDNLISNLRQAIKANSTTIHTLTKRYREPLGDILVAHSQPSIAAPDPIPRDLRGDKLFVGIHDFLEDQAAQDAQEKVLLAPIQRALGGSTHDGLPTIGQCTIRWLASPSRRTKTALKPTSIALYQYHINRLIAHTTDLPIDQLTRAHITTWLSNIASEGKSNPSTVAQHHKSVVALLTYAARNVGLASNVALGMDMPTADPRPIEERHHEALAWRDAPSFYERLCSVDKTAGHALRFTMLTTSRVSMVTQMRWQEVDLSSRVWTVPPDHMKSGKTFKVPISTPALGLLTDRKDKATQSPFVFPANRNGVHIRPATLETTMRSLTTAKIHGFRSTFMDWCRETSPEFGEAAIVQLDHSIGGGSVHAAYARSDLLERRRELLEAWGKFCAAS